MSGPLEGIFFYSHCTFTRSYSRMYEYTAKN